MSLHRGTPEDRAVALLSLLIRADRIGCAFAAKYAARRFAELMARQWGCTVAEARRRITEDAEECTWPEASREARLQERRREEFSKWCRAVALNHMVTKS
jgi:hypothetical protein